MPVPGQDPDPGFEAHRNIDDAVRVEIADGAGNRGRPDQDVRSGLETADAICEDEADTSGRGGGDGQIRDPISVEVTDGDRVGRTCRNRDRSEAEELDGESGERS